MSILFSANRDAWSVAPSATPESSRGSPDRWSDPATRRRNFSIRLLLGFSLLVASGCRPHELPPADEATAAARPTADAPHVDAQTRMQEVFRRYQGSSYYQDDGHVILRGPGTSRRGSGSSIGRDSQTESAPLRVHLDRHQLAVDAYTARIRVTARPLVGRSPAAAQERNEMIAWFEEPESSHFDAQVLRHRWESSAADRWRLEQLLRDEVLRSRLSAGLAGPPPQLEWLLADRPMEKLFDSQAEFQWLAPAPIGDLSLQRIEVLSNGERFVFWIQAETSLIRRVELPVPDLVTATTGSDRRAWSLSLELEGATFEPPQSDTPTGFAFTSQPRFQAKLVDQFIPLPPAPPSPLLGKRIDLGATTGLTREGNQSNEPETILISLPPTGPDELTAWLATWQRALPVLASREFQPSHLVVITADRDVVGALSSIPASMLTLLDPRAAKDSIRQLRLAEGSFAVLSKPVAQNSSAVILLSESQTNASTIANALAVIRDSLAGVDVLHRIESDYESIVRAYESRLSAARVSE